MESKEEQGKETIRRSERQAFIDNLKFSLYLLRRNPLVMAGILMVIFFVAVAVLSNVLVDPAAAGVYDFSKNYGWSKGSWFQWGVQARIIDDFHVFGTDGWGRDILQMIILALPLDLSIAVAIVAGSVAVGVSLGAVAGYIGGKLDEAILRITDIFFAFPGLVLAMVFAAVFGRNMVSLVLAVLAVWWPVYVRLIRGQVLGEKERTYVQALKAAGLGRTRILFRHILPNTVYPVLVQATLDLGGVVLTFSALMFLGFSPNPAMPELGNLASDGIGHFFEAPWLIIFPGLTILTIALAFNLLGDGLRDVLDPRLRR